jgi:rubrerythrin
MAIDQTTLKDALNSALNLEHVGHDYYVKIAGKAENTLTKEVFTALAGQELVHIERIQEIFNNLQFEGVNPHAQPDEMQKMIKGIFARFSSHERSTWAMDNSEAYEYAQDLERQSIAMYDKLAGESTNPVEKQFFDELSREENYHLNALENVFFFLQRTGDWFDHEESRVWNWMNT